jgi:putative phosphonate catabolism associated alcohol dehydrogenase
MARVVLFHGPNRPFEIVERATPQPHEGEIVVRVTCCALCTSDLHTHAGRRQVETPTVLGHEIVGCIEAFGPGAPRQSFDGRDLRVGERVSWSVTASCGSCFACSHELPQKCERVFKYGHYRDDAAHPFAGGLAEYCVLAPGSAMFHVPESLSDPVAASANCATATAAAVLRSANISPEKPQREQMHVVILGAGMLGVTASAMARSCGVETVIVVDPDGARRERARRFGATHVFASDAQTLERELRAVTMGRGADVVLELAGTSDSVQTALKVPRVGGCVILAGTVLPTPSVPLDPENAVRRMLTVRGVHNYAPRDLGTALAFLGGPGRAYPFDDLVGLTMRLDEVEGAFEFAHGHPGQRVAVVM